MKKIPSVFERDWKGNPTLVLPVPVEAAAWVFAGEGQATVKWDGTAVLIDEAGVWGRLDVKRGKTAPEGFRPAMEPDPVTGHWTGWILAAGRPEMKWILEAAAYTSRGNTVPVTYGTYEACGPKINGNPHGFETHRLIRHGADVIADVPRTFEALREFLGRWEVEGVVWHHPDGRMAKIKRKDFGYQWPIVGNVRESS